MREVQSHKIGVLGFGLQPPLTLSRDTESPLRWRLQADVFYRQKKLLGGMDTGGPGVSFSVGLVYQFGPSFPPGTCKSKDNRKACAPPPPAGPATQATTMSAP